MNTNTAETAAETAAETKTAAKVAKDAERAAENAETAAAAQNDAAAAKTDAAEIKENAMNAKTETKTAAAVTDKVAKTAAEIERAKRDAERAERNALVENAKCSTHAKDGGRAAVQLIAQFIGGDCILDSGMMILPERFAMPYALVSAMLAAENVTDVFPMWACGAQTFAAEFLAKFDAAMDINQDQDYLHARFAELGGDFVKCTETDNGVKYAAKTVTAVQFLRAYVQPFMSSWANAAAFARFKNAAKNTRQVVEIKTIHHVGVILRGTTSAAVATFSKSRKNRRAARAAMHRAELVTAAAVALAKDAAALATETADADAAERFAQVAAENARAAAAAVADAAKVAAAADLAPYGENAAAAVAFAQVAADAAAELAKLAA